MAMLGEADSDLLYAGKATFLPKKRWSNTKIRNMVEMEPKRMMGWRQSDGVSEESLRNAGAALE